MLRNALAEDEAQALSKHNAELLGHHNPAQRIMYVDRIRRELHDTKQVRPHFLLSPLFRTHAYDATQKLLAAMRERDGALVDNDGLQRESTLR